MLSYDIWCSYSVNLKKRFTEWFPTAASLIDKMRGAIPKLRIKNHVQACQLLWAFNYLSGSGETYGEMIETSWSAGNKASGSTKEMNDGHRHDILDDFHTYWNWCKFHKLCRLFSGRHCFLLILLLAGDLFDSYTKCIDTLKTREKGFHDYAVRMGKDLTTKWNKIDDTPRRVDGEVMSVHAANFKNGEIVSYCSYFYIYNTKFQGPPTQEKVYQNLLTKEVEAKLAGAGSVGDAQLIQMALDIEDDQFVTSLHADHNAELY